MAEPQRDLRGLGGLDPKLVESVENEILDSGGTGRGTKFDDIGGLEHVKERLEEMIIWPLKKPELFQGGLRRIPKGLLLFGPPGTGKTLIGKAIACESQATFFSISASSITSKWIGQSEKMVKVSQAGGGRGG